MSKQARCGRKHRAYHAAKQCGDDKWVRTDASGQAAE